HDPSLQLFSLYLHDHAHPPALPSSPTRRSSDLCPSWRAPPPARPRPPPCANASRAAPISSPATLPPTAATAGRSPRWTTSSSETDRKSTRLNSSHVAISYAVFCLKKKIRNESLL